MPSFVIHSICGKKLLSNLNLTKEDETKFYISNLMPDSTSAPTSLNYDEKEVREAIQNEKTITHFRTVLGGVIECPDLNNFLGKYGDKVKEDINVFDYFFHLFVDYQYFKFFIPKCVNFYDANMCPTTIRKDDNYVEIKKSKIIVPIKEFWSKSSNYSIYKDYNKINYFLINYFNLDINLNSLKEYIYNNEYILNIREVKSNKAIKEVEKLESIIQESIKTQGDDLYFFNKEEVIEFIDTTVDLFLENFQEYFKNYKNN